MEKSANTMTLEEFIRQALDKKLVVRKVNHKVITSTRLRSKSISLDKFKHLLESK